MFVILIPLDFRREKQPQDSDLVTVAAPKKSKIISDVLSVSLENIF